MPLDAIQERFIDEIKLRGYDDKYIDKNEEREVLQIAIHQGIGLDAARGALVEVAASLGYVLESDLMKQIKERFESAIANNQGVDQPTYNAVLNSIRTAAQGRRSDRDLMKLIVHVIEDGGLKVKSGWMFNWYKAVKREIGKT